MPHQPSGSLIVGGQNYGQSSSREHATLAPPYVGVKAVIAQSFARIHWQNLINFGILPLTFANPDDWNRLEEGDALTLPDVRQALRRGTPVEVQNQSKHETYRTKQTLPERQVQSILAGSLISLFHEQHRGSEQRGV